MTEWILILMMSCDSKGISTIKVPSKQICESVGKNFLTTGRYANNDTEYHWYNCKAYQCIEIK